MMHAEHWYRVTVLAAIFFVAAAGGTVFGDETSAGVSIPRGTPPAVQQTQRPQEIQVVPPPLASCPDGWPYSHFLFDYCYRPRERKSEPDGPLGSGTGRQYDRKPMELRQGQKPQRLTCINAGSAGCVTLVRPNASVRARFALMQTEVCATTAPA